MDSGIEGYWDSACRFLGFSTAYFGRLRVKGFDQSPPANLIN